LKIKNNSGQSLLEIVFIIGATILLLSGVVVATVFSIKMVRYSKRKAGAARLARLVVEAKKSDKQEIDFWNQDEVINSRCLTEGPVESVFYYQVCYDSYSSLVGKKRVNLEVAVWWDSVAKPTTEMNKVVVKTILSNWEE